MNFVHSFVEDEGQLEMHSPPPGHYSNHHSGYDQTCDRKSMERTLNEIVNGLYGFAI